MSQADRPQADEREADLTLAGLSIWVWGREFPECQDYWDGNWLNVRARVETFGARVEASGPFLRNCEIAGFADQLRRLYRDLKGSAALECLEPELGANVECDALGGLQVTIELTPDHISQSHRFEFAIDQTYLPPVLAQCATILERYPIRDADQGKG